MKQSLDCELELWQVMTSGMVKGLEEGKAGVLGNRSSLYDSCCVFRIVTVQRDGPGTDLGC